MKGVLFNVWNRNIGDRKLADSQKSMFVCQDGYEKKTELAT